ncbi:hypothetical protein ACVWWI_006403 [Bradyrhizobium sp. USDA 3686]
MQRFLRFLWQPDEFAEHQIDDVLGVRFCVNSLQIPTPAHRHVIERQQLLSG